MATILAAAFLLGLMLATTPGLAGAGTTGSFDSSTVNQVNQGDWLTLVFTGLNPNSDYIVVESTWGNVTFSTGSGQTATSITIKIDVSGSLDFNLYGYNASTGYATGSSISHYLVTSTNTGTNGATQLTNLIPTLIGLLIAAVILGVIFEKKIL